jgi:hypothetical protein
MCLQKLHAKIQFRCHPWREFVSEHGWLRQSHFQLERRRLVIFVLAILLVRGAVEKVIEIGG